MIFAGIDIGSRTTKACLMENGSFLSYGITKTTPDIPKTAYAVLSEALRKKDLSMEEIVYIVATGYGRISVPFAKRHITEISCHALGTTFFSKEIRTVLDMGGQDLKVIRCDEKGRVIKFLMNDKCAAGTGRFLERVAEALKVPLDLIGDLSLNPVHGPEKISSHCVVFALDDVLSLLRQGRHVNDIFAGLSDALAERILTMMKRLGIERDVAICGGIAKNKGIVRRIEEMLGFPVFLPSEPQIVGALGAAIFARRLYEEQKRGPHKASFFTTSLP